jgi:general stress protein YciG
METPKEYHYTYYSYEEWGRGYFGSRTCRCLPENDVKYFGSFKDKTFNPKCKIIIKDDYVTRAEAYADEIILHDFYDVGNNPHFSNRAKATSTGFCYFPSREWASKNGKKSAIKNKQNKVGIFGLTKEERVINARKANKTNKKNNTGIYAITPEQKKEHSKKAGQKTYELKIGVHALTKEQLSENGKKGGTISGEKNKENKTGVCGRSKEKMSEDGKKSGTISGKKHKENKTGVCGRSKEKMSEDGRKGGISACKIINAQRWECCETGYVSTSAGVVAYQRARGIDTSKSNRSRIA